MSAVNEVRELSAGVIRTDRTMNDGRTIRYYDTASQIRNAHDLREAEEQPSVGELRLDPLVNEWVAMAAHRQGRIFLPPKELCPLCPTTGDLRTEIPESEYEVVVFDNRSPSLRPPEGDFALPDLAGADTDEGVAAGKCEVICFTGDHGGSFKTLSPSRVRTLLEAWRDRTAELSQLSYIEHIAPFENRGEEIGVTLAHPHGQIYAYSFIPPRTAKMLAVAREHKERTGRPLMVWKVATTLDSKVAASDGTSQWITGPESREDVQALRAQSDAIVIGTNTALVDNPHLIPRGHAARPVRIVCGEQVVPPTHRVFDNEARTISVKTKSIPELIKVLTDEGFNQVLVEAGPTLGSALMASGKIDELIVYQAPKMLGAGKEFVSHLGISTLADHIELELLSVAQFGGDIKSHYIVRGR